MTTRSLLIFVIVFVAGASFWLFRVDKGLTSARQMITEQRQQSPPRRTVTSVPPPSSQEIARETLRGQLRAEIQGLENRLQSERDRLSSQENQLSQLQSAGQQQTTTATPNYNSEIDQNRMEISNILNELRGFESMETYINQRAAEVLRDQSSSAGVARQELDNNIRTQENLIAQSAQQMSALEDYRNYIDQREVKIEQLRQTMINQQAQLDAMRQQRLTIASSVLESDRKVQGEKDQALIQLNNERSDMNEQIMSLRSEINRLQAEQANNRMSTISRSAQISRVEQNIDDQNKKIQSIESNLREKETQLNALVE